MQPTFGGISPYAKGKEDHAKGLALVANPYSQIHQAGAFKAWNEGWTDAMQEANGKR